METIQHLYESSSLHPSVNPERAEKVELTIEQIDEIISDHGFPAFVEHVFSKSVDILKDGQWIGGDFPMDIAAWMGKEKKTLRVSAKDHFKSMSFYAHIMWKIYKLYYTEKNREINYFSYKENMAAYHLAKIKTAIKCNPYFEDIIDLKPQADSILSYTWDLKKKIKVYPRGLIGFKRGIHCDDVYVDDPFQDPENKMVPTKIMLINKVMKTQILDMFQQELHIAGTAQTNHDFFFDDDFVKRFSRRILPAMVDQKNRIALWPEWMSFDELESKKIERGEKIFNQEYLCSPVYAENAYLTKERLYAVATAPKNYSFAEWKKFKEEREAEAEAKEKPIPEYDLVAGWDLGKKGHPAHFVVYELRGRLRVQVHDKWFDRIDYTDQLEYLTEALEAFGFYKLFYDATRGEMEMAEEKGDLPGEFEGVHFTFKGKHAMAAEFDKLITRKGIQLLNIPRSLSQMLIVNNDLQAPETPEGHGDSFWSTCLTLNDLLQEGTDVNFV